MESLSNKIFKNEFTSNFPGDHTDDHTPRQTPGVLYSKAYPTPVINPKLLAWTDNLADEMKISNPTEEDISVLAGNKVTSSMKPYAACYGGHQFGNWAGQLGDGRAITLGEWSIGKKTWELQLKGAGPTTYSRSADGRAVLRSSVREYLMSEAMFHLGISTTRALSLVSTGENVLRDMFYNGNAAYEPGAIVMRTAPSFLRFGNFEILAARNEHANLNKLVNWTINNFYPHIKGEKRIIRWFEEVVERTADLMVEWHRVGFVHGVMNTDNMSILGLTIDYGPFSFIDDYDPNFTPNTTDLPGKRYAFGNQPSIGYWNLGKLASALLPIFNNEPKELEEILRKYEEIFWDKYYSMMKNKLGLDELNTEDRTLIADFEKVLSTLKPDMTIFYQKLIDLPSKTNSDFILEHFTDSFYGFPAATDKKELVDLINKYSARLTRNKISRSDSQKMMKRANPRFVLRNYLLHQAIEELDNGKSLLFEKLRLALQSPYSTDHDEFLVKRPDWASKKAGCSMLSCSS